MTVVLPYQSFHPLIHAITRTFEVVSLGDGYSQTTNGEQSRARADGMGGQTSHCGLNAFTLNFSVELDDVGEFGTVSESQRRANALWDFFRDRIENDNEPFYFYNPEENRNIDLTGANTTGRYLVRLANPNEALSREYYVAGAFRFSSINLIEVRE